jgi:hypothetical protein
MLDVEYVAMARLVTPGRLLSGAQSLARIGDRVIGIQGKRPAHPPMNH